MKNLNISNICLVIIVFSGCFLCYGGVVHKNHNHGHHDHISINKERESDGAYSPKSQDHLARQHTDFEHEAILGSVKEAEEYEHLPPEEAKKRLAILVTKMDVNKDGYVDRTELREWILQSFRKLTEEEATEKLEDADENHDGKISWSEYLTDTYGVDSDEDESLKFHEENVHLISEDKEMWETADKDQDGFLEFQEWVIFSSPEEYAEMHPIILGQTLKAKDKDNDSAINFQEFIGDQGTELTKEALQIEKYKFDKELDINNDGLLTGKEILQWVVQSNEVIADEEVLHLFAHSDDDHDDLLSYDEIIDHHEIFVGSEATDYGDHLHNIHQFNEEL